MHRLLPQPTTTGTDSDAPHSDPGQRDPGYAGPGREDTGGPPEVSDQELEQLYDYPAGLTAPWVQVNFVTSADGAVSVSGRSEGLSSPGDKRIFSLGRDLADVVLVGAGTAMLEDYGPVRDTDRRRSRRARLGRRPVPPIAVVTGQCSLTPQSRLITEAASPSLILTCAAAPARRREALADAGAEVLVLGDDAVDPTSALRALAERGMYRVCCEGGPQLFGQLIADDLVDQLCLTVSPLLAGGDAGRIATGTLPGVPRSMSLASALHEDGFLMLRYRRHQR